VTRNVNIVSRTWRGPLEQLKQWVTENLEEIVDAIRTLVPCFFFLITYLLTPWSRVLLEKRTGLQLVKKFPAFYKTRRFLAALTSARHLSLS
jgi:hypothetical protein